MADYHFLMRVDSSSRRRPEVTSRSPPSISEVRIRPSVVLTVYGHEDGGGCPFMALESRDIGGGMDGGAVLDRIREIGIFEAAS